jgi:hypothetical protein
MTGRSMLLTAFLAGCGGCATSPVVLRATGVGAVTFGQPVAEAGVPAAGQSADAVCRYVEYPSLPGLRLTVENGVITRADAGPTVRNALGVQLGDTTDSVVALYPEVAVERSGASVGGTNLVIADPGGRHAIVLQAAGNKIIAIRAGLLGSVGRPEGCP